MLQCSRGEYVQSRCASCIAPWLGQRFCLLNEKLSCAWPEVRSMCYCCSGCQGSFSLKYSSSFLPLTVCSTCMHLLRLCLLSNGKGQTLILAYSSLRVQSMGVWPHVLGQKIMVMRVCGRDATSPLCRTQTEGVTGKATSKK